jgi:hypothetical protein
VGGGQSHLCFCPFPRTGPASVPEAITLSYTYPILGTMPSDSRKTVILETVFPKTALGNWGCGSSGRVPA